MTVVFAAIAPILFCGAVMAVDFTRIVTARTQIQSTLDAATLSAVNATDIASARAALANGVATARRRTSVLASQDLQVSAEIRSYDGVTVETAASVTVPVTFASLLGKSGFLVQVNATAARASYQDIYFAIDLSSSGGVAATDADRQALEALTQPYSTPAYGSRLPQGCAFGCHRREGWEPAGKTVYQMAREAGIRLREDELKSQFNGLVDLLLDPADPTVQQGMRRVGVIGFGNNAQLLVAPTNSAASAKTAIDAFADTDRYETVFASAFNQFGAMLGAQGNGTVSSPKKMLVLITDGVESRDAFYAQRAVDLSLCDSIKAAGFRLSIVEIKYPKLLNNALYDDTVLPVENTVSPAMSACASPGWYFQALDNTEIPAKFNTLKDRIVSATTRLTR